MQFNKTLTRLRRRVSVEFFCRLGSCKMLVAGIAFAGYVIVGQPLCM